MPSSSPKTVPMTPVISSAPTLPRAARRSVSAVKPETSTKSNVPSRRRWTASGELPNHFERQPRDKGRQSLGGVNFGGRWTGCSQVAPGPVPGGTPLAGRAHFFTVGAILRRFSGPVR